MMSALGFAALRCAARCFCSRCVSAEVLPVGVNERKVSLPAVSAHEAKPIK